MRWATAQAAALCAAAWGHAQQPLSVDTTFRTSIVERYVGDVHFMDDGNILLSGNLTFASETWLANGIALLDQTGVEFYKSGGPGAGRIIPWQDKLFIGHNRLNTDLTEDFGYDLAGPNNPFVEYWNDGQIHVYPDGKVITTGSLLLRSYEDTTTIGVNYCFVRLDTIAYPDSTFTHRQCQTGYASRIFEMDDGRFILSGTMAGYDGQAVGRILRVWPDGSLDTTFQTTIYNGAAHDIWTYPDGRLLAAGIFSLPEYPSDTLHLIRLLPNGDIDTTFPNTIDFRWPDIYWPSIITINGIFQLLPDVLVLTGTFTHVEGMDVGGLIAIDTAGNLLHDQYFTGTGCDTVTVGPNEAYRALNRMEQAPDGSYYIYGTYRGFDDGYAFWEDQPFITRLHPLNVGIESHEIVAPTLLVSPNPGDDFLVINGTGSVRVYDAQGHIIEEFDLYGHVLKVDARAWSSGTYLIRLIDKSGMSAAAKWLKQ